MRIAYFSPLNPQRSGISDYSEELLPHLAARAEIDLFTDGFRPSDGALADGFRCFDYRSEPAHLARLAAYDAALYHVGNDHRYHAGIYEAALAHPGVVVLHDFSLQNFFLGLARERRDMGIYLDELEACHGRAMRAGAEEMLVRGAVPTFQTDPVWFPLNCRLLRASDAVVVHSEWSRARVRAAAPGTPVRRINHHVLPAPPSKRGAARAGGRVEIASFGHVTTEKGIGRTLGALAALRERCDFHYTLVGQPDNFDVSELVRSHGLSDRFTLTGYVTLEEFQRRIAEADVAVNLRERTVGETSGSVCRAMAAGVPVVVSNIGWFAELPDDAVVKIDVGEEADTQLRAYLARLIEDEHLRRRIGENARRHAATEHAIERSAREYLDFIEESITRRVRRRLLRAASDELARVGIDASDARLLRTVAEELAQLVPSELFERGMGDGG
jgi:glycosyltransferase involved in cell wall biosynthesis